MRPIAPLLALLLLSAAPLGAQSLPFHRPLNPLARSRTGLAAQPYVPFSPFGDRLSFSVEYGNAIDYELPEGAPLIYLLDAELMRTSVGYTRDLGARAFLALQVDAIGAYDGFADGFFDWYHDIIGYDQPEREARPTNTYDAEIALPDGTRLSIERRSLALGDVRGAIGYRHNLTQQTTFGLALPAGLALPGSGRTVAVSAVHTLRLELTPDIVFEGSIGAGAAPRQGPLADYQRTAFLSGSTGLRIRLWGGQSIYGYFFGHSPYYRGTQLPSLDSREVTGDFGWIMRDRQGREWRVGFSEDLSPGDAGIDLILKISRTY